MHDLGLGIEPPRSPLRNNGNLHARALRGRPTVVRILDGKAVVRGQPETLCAEEVSLR